MPYCTECDGEGGRESRLPGKGWTVCKRCAGRGTDTPGVLSSKVMIRMGDKASAEQRERLERERMARLSAEDGQQRATPPKPDVRGNVAHLAEERATRLNDAAKWSVRDALQHALRRIDAGELHADWCCLIFKKNPTAETSYQPDYVRAGHADPDAIRGVLANVGDRIVSAAEDD